jgi:hypothetical protein
MATIYAVAMDQVKRTRMYPIVRSSLPGIAVVCHSHAPPAYAGAVVTSTELKSVCRHDAGCAPRLASVGAGGDQVVHDDEVTSAAECHT